MRRTDWVLVAIAATVLLAGTVATYWPKKETVPRGPMEITSPTPGQSISNVFDAVVTSFFEPEDGDVLRGWVSVDGENVDVGSTVLSAGQLSAVLHCDCSTITSNANLKTGTGTLFTIMLIQFRGAVPVDVGVEIGVDVAPWVKYGSSAADALLWDTAANHRYYRGGNLLQGQPAGWDMDAGEKSLLPANIIFGGLPIPFSTGDYIAKVYLTTGGVDHLWMEMNLDGETSGASWSATVEEGARAGLPYAANGTWAGYLGRTRAEQTLRVDLVRASDSVVLATDTAAWIMTVRQPSRGIAVGALPLERVALPTYRM